MSDQEYFVIARISRADVAGKLRIPEEIAAQISDDDMETLARKMGNDYLEQLYWDQIECLAEVLESLPARDASFMYCQDCKHIYVSALDGEDDKCPHCGGDKAGLVWLLVDRASYPDWKHENGEDWRKIPDSVWAKHFDLKEWAEEHPVFMVEHGLIYEAEPDETAKQYEQEYLYNHGCIDINGKKLGPDD